MPHYDLHTVHICRVWYAVHNDGGGGHNEGGSVRNLSGGVHGVRKSRMCISSLALLPVGTREDGYTRFGPLPR